MIPARITPFLGILILVTGCFDVDALRSELESRRNSPWVQPEEDVRGADTALPDSGFIPDAWEPPDLTPPDLEELDSGEFLLLQVLPGQAGIEGGTPLLLVGEGFHDQMEVYFGEARGSRLFVVDSRFATVETPPHPPGVVDVLLLGQADQRSVLHAGFTFTARVSLTDVQPESGGSAGGTPVILMGTGFEDGCTVFFGSRMATGVHIMDSFQMTAITPPGHCGDVDVRVLCGESSFALESGFRYQGVPRLDSVSPEFSPASGGHIVEVRGRNFTPDTEVTVNGVPVTRFEFVAPSLVRFVVPPGEAGPASLIASNSCGQGNFSQPFLLTGPPLPGGTQPRILHIVPDSASACTGGRVVLAVEVPGSPSWFQVLVGGQSVDVLEAALDDGYVVIRVPPQQPGRWDVQMLTPLGVALVPEGFTYHPDMVLTSVQPDSGHRLGGSTVELHGCGFTPGMEVRFGELSAQEVAYLSGKRLRVTTPPGSPGPVDVTAVDASGSVRLPAAFSYTEDAPAIYFVDPDTGAQAGGTWVRVVGTGLPEGGSFRFGTEDAFAIQYVDSHLAVMRAPPNPVGKVPVSIEHGGVSLTKDSAYSYFDPYSAKGGVWGGRIRESLNVTVRDSTLGGGILGALVIVGSDPATQHKGYTDSKGQITFSVPGFAGKQSITAAYPGYSMSSIIHFDARNAILSLSTQSTGSGGTSTPYVAPKAFVTGRVRGLDKYLVTPMGPCLANPGAGPQCQPCQSSLDCPSLHFDDPETQTTFSVDYICTELPDSVRGCTRTCTDSWDCPEGFVCALSGPQETSCIPARLKPEVRCTTSKSSLFGQSPDPGPGGIVNAHQIYFASTLPGEVAVVCYGGYLLPGTNQFEPTVMGIRRNVIVLKDQVVMDQDVTLTIPLNRSGRIAFHSLPSHPRGLRQPYLMASIELGKDGFLDLPKKPVWDTVTESFLVQRLPDRLDGPLEGLSYSVYVSVQSKTDYSIPYAVRMESDIPSLSGEGMVSLSNGVRSSLFPPVSGSIVGMARTGPDHLIVASSDGNVSALSGGVWTPVPVAGTGEGLTRVFKDRNGDVWLAGKAGSVWRFDGTGWQKWPATLAVPIVDLWGGQGRVAALYNNVIRFIEEGQVVKTLALPPQRVGKALWGSSFDDLWVVTDNHSIWRVRDSLWTLAASYDQVEFTDVDGSGPDDVWFSADPAMVLRYDGSTFREYPLPESPVPLRRMFVHSPLEVLAVGHGGLAVLLEQDQFRPVDTQSHQDFWAASFDPAMGELILAGAQAHHTGPFMAFPRLLDPVQWGTSELRSLKWGYWTEGAQASFHNIIISNAEGYPFWTLVVDGMITEVPLPPVSLLLGFQLVPAGVKRINLTSSLNDRFSIDQFTNNDFSMYDKVSWAVDMVQFY